MARLGRSPKIDVASLCRAYSVHGVRVTGLMERFGINQGTAYYHLKRAGIWKGKPRSRSGARSGSECLGARVPFCLVPILDRANRVVERVESQ